MAIVFALYKKNSRFLPGNYRPISLVDTYGKLFVRILTTRLAKAVDERLGNTQYGFRKGWGGMANIFYILQLSEQCHELLEEALIVIFLDLKMCFDRIRSEELRSALQRTGVKGKMLEMIMCLHKDLKFRVRVGNTMSSERTRGRGLRQGDPAAGLLCIIVLALVYSDAKEDLATHVDPEVREQDDSDPIKSKEALYADDAASPGLASKLKRLQAYIISIISKPFVYTLNKVLYSQHLSLAIVGSQPSELLVLEGRDCEDGQRKLGAVEGGVARLRGTRIRAQIRQQRARVRTHML